MARYYPRIRRTSASSQGESLTLEEAVRRGISWDVFVSHKSSDTSLATQVAGRIQRCNLSVWLDVAYLQPTEEGPQLATKIRNVISRSFALMAVVTHRTKDSWWVPFEIGLAFELDRYLASYASAADLPSFLSRWPCVMDQAGLVDWCEEIKKIQPRDGRLERLLEDLEGPTVHRSMYLNQMKRMTNRFSS